MPYTIACSLPRHARRRAPSLTNPAFSAAVRWGFADLGIVRFILSHPATPKAYRLIALHTPLLSILGRA